MTFVYANYAVIIVAIVGIYLFFLARNEKRFYLWVQDHWFFIRSKKNKFSFYLYVIAWSLFAVSILDARGPQEKVKANVPQQKTIILIDTSASMLVEDVRPNRLKKSVFLARHFVKRAVGHEIAVSVFADIQKKVVPFTDDLDLLDSRLQSLESLDIKDGGSNLTAAIAEAANYFLVNGGNEEGNILIFTDAEETEKFKYDFPKNITVAVVGVGTAKGGKIPLRDKRGNFRGYKKFNGIEVTSKLDEGFLSDFKSKIKNYRSWIAHTYAVPTDEILNFFNSIYKKRYSQGDVVVRPVLNHYFFIPAVIIMIIVLSLRRFSSFSAASIIFLLISSVPANSYSSEKIEDLANKAQELESKLNELKDLKSELIEAANESTKAKKELEEMRKKVEEQMSGKKDEKPKLSASDQKLKEKLLNQFKDNQVRESQKLKLAELFLKEGELETSIKLYDEIGRNGKIKDPKARFNYATALLTNKDYAGALSEYSELLKGYGNESNREFIDLIRKNTLLALIRHKNQEQQKQKDNENKKNDENKDNQKKNQQQQSNDNKNKDAKNKDKKNKQDSEDKKNKDKEEKDKKKSSKNEEKREKEKQEKEKQNKLSQEDVRKLKKKIPAVLQQLMSEDRKLQKKLIDTSSTQNNKKKKKDW